MADNKSRRSERQLARRPKPSQRKLPRYKLLLPFRNVRRLAFVVQLSSRYNIFPLSENTPHRQAHLLARADIAKLSFPSAPSWSLPVAIDYLCSSSPPCPCGSRRRPLPTADFFHTAPCNSLSLHHPVSSRSLHPLVRQKSGGQRWQISAPTTSFWVTEAADRRAQALNLRAPPGRRHLVPHHAHPGRRHGASRYRSRASGHGARPSTSRPSHWSRAAGHGARPSTPDDPGLPQGSRDLSTKTQDCLGRTLAGPQPCSSATVKTNCHKCRWIVNVVWRTSCDRRGYCDDCIRWWKVLYYMPMEMLKDIQVLCHVQLRQRAYLLR